MNALLLVTVKEISPKLQGLTIIIDLGSSSVKAGFAQENGMALFIYIFIYRAKQAQLTKTLITSLTNTKHVWESFMMPDRKVKQEQTEEFRA